MSRVTRTGTMVAAIACLTVLGGCSSLHWGNFRKLSVDPAVAKAATPVGTKRVSGRACRAFLRPRHVADAARTAIAEQPGARALINVEVRLWYFVFWNCVSVEGLPVK